MFPRNGIGAQALPVSLRQSTHDAQDLHMRRRSRPGSAPLVVRQRLPPEKLLDSDVTFERVFQRFCLGSASPQPSPVGSAAAGCSADAAVEGGGGAELAAPAGQGAAAPAPAIGNRARRRPTSAGAAAERHRHPGTHSALTTTAWSSSSSSSAVALRRRPASAASAPAVPAARARRPWSASPTALRSYTHTLAPKSLLLANRRGHGLLLNALGGRTNYQGETLVSEAGPTVVRCWREHKPLPLSLWQALHRCVRAYHELISTDCGGACSRRAERGLERVQAMVSGTQRRGLVPVAATAKDKYTEARALSAWSDEEQMRAALRIQCAFRALMARREVQRRKSARSTGVRARLSRTLDVEFRGQLSFIKPRQLEERPAHRSRRARSKGRRLARNL
jgi:hypothetical protein